MPVEKNSFSSIAQNGLLVAVARAAMAMTIPAFVIFAAYIGSQNVAIASVSTRVVTLETRADIVGKSRDETTRAMNDKLQRLDDKTSQILQTLAAIVARLDEKERK